MAKRKTYLISNNFETKLNEIKDAYKQEGATYTNEELLDEMIDLYYAIVFLKSDHALITLLNDCITNTLEQFTNMNARFFNTILEQIQQEIKK